MCAIIDIGDDAHESDNFKIEELQVTLYSEVVQKEW